jgi:hypothetical protein
MRGSSKRRPLRRAILMLLHDTQSSSLQPPIEFRHEIAVAGGDDRRFWLGTCVCLFGSNNRRDEAIPTPGHGLYEPWCLGVILQDLTKLADRAPDTVVGIQENALAPNPGNDLIPGNNLVPVLKQKENDLETGCALASAPGCHGAASEDAGQARSPRRTGSVAAVGRGRRPSHTPTWKWMEFTTHSETPAETQRMVPLSATQNITPRHALRYGQPCPLPQECR